MEDARTGVSVRFGLDRRWATLAVAVALGASGGTVLGFLTTPGGVVDASTVLSPPQAVAPSTTRHPRSRFAGASSTTTTARPRRYPAATAAPTPTSTVRPTTTATTLPPTTTTTTIQPTTTTTVASTTSSITSTSLGTTTTR